MLFNYLTNYHLTRSKGIVLILVLYILVVFVIVGLVLVTLMVINNQSSYQLLYSTQAYYLAEAGVEYGLYQLSSDPLWLVDDGALSFDGNDYVNVKALNLTGSNISVEAWIKPLVAIQNAYARIVSTYNGINSSFMMAYDSTGTKVRMLVTTSSGSQTAISTTSLTDTTKWYHCVGVYNGSNVQIFINNVNENSQSISGNLSNTGNNLGIGSDYNGGNYYQGTIDEVRIYNRALSSEEIQYSYNYKTPMNRTGLVAWYKFVSGYPGYISVVDSSGNGNNGIVYGATYTTGVYKGTQVSLATGVNFNPPGQTNCVFSVAFNTANSTSVQNGILISTSSVPATQIISFDRTPAQRVVSVNVPRVY